MAEGSLKLALQWKELFAEAKQQIDSGDFAGSLSTLEKAQEVIESLAAAENTGRPELRLAETFERMAYAYHQQGILTDAERLYRSALEIASAHMISFFVKEAISQNLAKLLIETGREEEGQALLQRYPVRDVKPAKEVELSQQLVESLLRSVSNLVLFAGDKAAQVSSLMGELVDYCENAYGSDSYLFAEAAMKQGKLQIRMEISSANVWFKRALLATLNSGCAHEDIVPIAVDVALSERNSTLGKALTIKYPDRNEHSIHNIANSVAQKISAQLGATAPSSTVSSSTTPSMSVADAEQVIEDWRKSQPAIVGILTSEAERYTELLALIDKALVLVEGVERNESHPLSTISILSQKSRLLQKLGDIAAAKACKEKELQVISSHWGEGHTVMIEAYEEYLKLGKAGDYPNLQPIMDKAINWQLIKEQYDEMVKCAVAIKTRTADAEAILRRFTKDNLSHPTYKAFLELGRVLKTIFLCRYLCSEALRREIHEGLNVIENWNSVNSFIHFGQNSKIVSNNLEDQELSMLCMHLLQVSLNYINTLMLQEVLSEPDWSERMTVEDWRGLSPLGYAHVTYGNFTCNMNKRIKLKAKAA